MSKQFFKLFIVVISLFASTSSTFALGGYATLSGDDKNVAEVIKKGLLVSDEDAYQIFDGYLKSQINTKDWSYDAYSNETISGSKVDKSINRYLFINFVTDNRFVNISMIKFANEKQVFIQTVETLPRSTQTTIDKSDEFKKDKTYKRVNENDFFATYKKDGYTDKVKLLTYSGIGAIQYVDLRLYELKQ